MPKTMSAYFDFSNTKYEVTDRKNSANIVIKMDEVGYLVSADQSVSENEQLTIRSWIEHFHLMHHYPYLSDEEIATLDFLLSPHITYDIRSVSNHEGGFIFITMIYFMMLGFSSTVANEVVSEKISNMLDMMLTSVTYKQHFYAKIMIGWLTILCQAGIWLFTLFCWASIRIIYDQGASLYAFLHRIGLIKHPYESFFDYLQSFEWDFAMVMMLIMGVLFLFLGILLVQLLLLLVSVKINNIEESASIQAPFYLVMLLFYYCTLAINNYQTMQLGIGRYLSYIPGFSMLLMPVRILYYDVFWVEIIFGLVISVMTLWTAYALGLRHYHHHLTESKK